MSHPIYQDFYYFILSTLFISITAFSVLHHYSQELQPDNFAAQADIYAYDSELTPKYEIYHEILRSSHNRARQTITVSTQIAAHTSSGRL